MDAENKVETTSVHSVVDDLGRKADRLKEMADSTNIALAEMRIQFETLAEMQKEERIETQRITKENEERTREHYEKIIKGYKHIIIGLIVTLCVFMGGVFGGLAYLFTNYDIAFGSVEFAQGVGGDGNPVIYDGIHYSYAN